MNETIRLRIPYEDDEFTRFEYVGACSDGSQILGFVTGAFPADYQFADDWPRHKRWYAVLHRFDAEGVHQGTVVRSGGTTHDGEAEAIASATGALADFLAGLPPWTPGDIWIQPFAVELDGYQFGLLHDFDEDPDEPEEREEYLLLMPSDIMFHPPWESGDYST